MSLYVLILDVNVCACACANILIIYNYIPCIFIFPDLTKIDNLNASSPCLKSMFKSMMFMEYILQYVFFLLPVRLDSYCLYCKLRNLLSYFNICTEVSLTLSQNSASNLYEICRLGSESIPLTFCLADGCGIFTLYFQPMTVAIRQVLLVVVVVVANSPSNGRL